jgi:hypothetical protein
MWCVVKKGGKENKMKGLKGWLVGRSVGFKNADQKTSLSQQQTCSASRRPFSALTTIPRIHKRTYDVRMYDDVRTIVIECVESLRSRKSHQQNSTTTTRISSSSSTTTIVSSSTQTHSASSKQPWSC